VTSRHPVDAQGRILPHPGWPLDRAAPSELELLRRFCNSINHENGADRFSTGDGFDAWLESEGHHPTHPGTPDLETIIAFRGALHDITVANQRRRPSPAGWERMAHTLDGTRFSARSDADSLVLVPVSGSPTDMFLGGLALICIRARHDGTFGRLKSCSNCEWTIYDNSKNQSARWCSMTACGGRHNARAYRRRRREP